MAGFDPAIHGAVAAGLDAILHSQGTRHRVDVRVRPGHDDL
jgi:hypothetical protein